MLNTREHRPNQPFRINPNYPSNPTHLFCAFCALCAFLLLNFEWVALAERVEHAKGGATGRRQLINTYRRWTTAKHARANLSHLCLLPFILRLQDNLLFAPI